MPIELVISWIKGIHLAQEASPVYSSLRGLNYGSAAHPGITMRSPGSSRPPSLQRSPSKWNVEPPMLLGTCCNCLMVLGPGVSANQLAVTHQLSILAFGCPVSGIQGSRLFKGLPGTVQVTQTIQGSTWNSSSPGSYSTTRTLLYPWKNRMHHPPMGDWVVLPTPYHQHTSTQRVS